MENKAEEEQQQEEEEDLHLTPHEHIKASIENQLKEMGSAKIIMTL